jgi:hypothetical protein
MGWVDVPAAAERLGVSQRQVRNLVAHGDLQQVARGLIDEASLRHYLAVRGGSHQRTWTEPTAWGAVALLSGVEASWMGAPQRSRLRSTLTSLTAADLVVKARNRASVHRFHVLGSLVEALRAEVVESGTGGRVLGMSGARRRVDGYVSEARLQRLVSAFALEQDPTGEAVLRATCFDIDAVRRLVGAGDALTALDLAESTESRERVAGAQHLEELLRRLRG